MPMHSMEKSSITQPATARFYEPNNNNTTRPQPNNTQHSNTPPVGDNQQAIRHRTSLAKTSSAGTRSQPSSSIDVVCSPPPVCHHRESQTSDDLFANWLESHRQNKSTTTTVVEQHRHRRSINSEQELLAISLLPKLECHRVAPKQSASSDTIGQCAAAELPSPMSTSGSVISQLSVVPPPPREFRGASLSSSTTTAVEEDLDGTSICSSVDVIRSTTTKGTKAHSQIQQRLRRGRMRAPMAVGETIGESESLLDFRKWLKNETGADLSGLQSSAV